MIEFPTVTYNLAPGRGERALNEVSGLLKAHRPAVLYLQETVGYHLREILGYDMLHSQANRSEWNVSAYVRKDWPVSWVRWVPLEETWGRTQHDGEHEARTILAFQARGVQCLGIHMPPKGTDNTEKAQAECLQKAERLMTPWKHRKGVNHRSRLRPRNATGDFNGEANTLADMINGTNAAGITDTSVSKYMKVLSTQDITFVPGLDLESDHNKAVEIVYGVARRYARV